MPAARAQHHPAGIRNPPDLANFGKQVGDHWPTRSPVLGIRPRRSSRHRSFQRPAGHRQLPGRILAGTAAPLNPRLPGTTNSLSSGKTPARKSCSARPTEHPTHVKAAEGKVPVYSLEMDAGRLRQHRPARAPRQGRRSRAQRRPPWSCTPAAAPAAPNASPSVIATWPLRRRNIVDHYQLSPSDVSPVRHARCFTCTAWSPRPISTCFRAERSWSRRSSSSVVLAHRSAITMSLVFRGPHHPSASALARLFST